MKSETYESVKGQMGPCVISCAGCDFSNGKTAETAKKTKEYLQNYGVSDWAAFVPRGSEIDFDQQLFKSLDWMPSSVGYLGCENGGGPPVCTIRKCANEKGYDICSKCSELEGCTKFDWLGDYASVLRGKLEATKVN